MELSHRWTLSRGTMTIVDIKSVSLTLPHNISRHHVVTKVSPDYNFTWEPGANLPDASTPLVRMVLVTVQSNAIPLLFIYRVIKRIGPELLHF